MPKNYRLTGEELKGLSGKRLHGRLFSLLVAPIEGAHAKCAFVVSKKAAAKAPERNLIRRRARAAFAKKILSIEKPLALVFHAKREAARASFPDIARDIDALASRL